MSITVDKVIKREPLVINENATIKEAINIMSRENVGLLVIVNNAGKPIGVISERDIIRALARGKDLNAKVTEVGTVGKLVTISPRDSIYKAALLMNDHKIRHLVVMDNDKLRGVISIRDIISEERVVSRLAELAEAKPSEAEAVGAD
ncbi:CBS domain-containing protein [Vulcanisaeta distributa]|uniref:Putative signal transduction protein with CBS domains n=1 Tax=Vulcanisaeta distributa (strain DSM 14429 / JCM 11212 / NBRC 100878 / IC-017) TaxID=572478 RepID=E1QND7_VULDI|nr:CBS domain-containing protein [Vulcanisaeta distributa]ADN50107.1 putative signal transduction protein with CBS domains [Vulcanisaeta distributa DSM 14429]